LHAGFTADAALIVEVNDPIGTPEKRDGRANFDTRRVVAMVATQHGEVSARIGIKSFLDVFDPSPIHADGNVVLFLARDRTRMTTDATVLIDNESVAHSRPVESENLTIAIKVCTLIAGKIRPGQIEKKL
jgi:hypothetical protein